MQVQSRLEAAPLQPAAAQSQPQPPAGQPPKPAVAESLKGDGLKLDIQRAKSNTLSLIGGTGAGVLAATGSAALVGTLIGLRGEGILIGAGVGGVGIGLSAGAVGAVSSRFLTSDPSTGALVGALSGAVTGGALPHAYAGSYLGGAATLLGATVGAAAGAASGWAAARIQQD